ncbi:carboxypeptidase regulatory-like domain-containing protein [Myxococcus sp. Y35]|uniref:carboxypeptidase regulatory-like domain-containing protein n=1 Tax=Pseudomyxococcus flavus TaxID=3115648 RepID=UPI003CF61F71
MRPTGQRARWPWAAALMLLLAGLVAWWLWPVPAGVPGALPAPVVRAEGTVPARVAPPPEPTKLEGLQLRVVLEGGQPFLGEARVGAAFISERDRHLWEESKRVGGEGAGPGRLEDLANVSEWRSVDVTPSATGGVLGPIPVPPAPRYQVVAWAPDGTFWWGDIAPDDVPIAGLLDGGVLFARRPTGVRVTLAGARPEHGPFSVRMERAASLDPRDAEHASELLPVVRHVAPAIASALADGTPLPLPVGEPLSLLPLPSDPQVRLWLRSAAGQEGGPVEVPLRDGRVESVVLDVDRLFPGGVGGAVTLRGRLVLEGTSAPPEGVTLLGPDGRVLALAQDGSFVAPGLPSWAPSQFIAEVVAPASGRPVAAARQTFDFMPEPGVAEAQVSWRVTAYRWLVLRVDGFLRGQLGAGTRRPYPVFVLQRWSDGDVWRTHAADAFLQEEGGVAVSLLAPGRYRVLVALSAHEHYVSTVAEVGEDGAEHAVSVQVDTAGPACEVLVTAAGAPVYGARVIAGSEVVSLPPARGLTDAEGRWRLGRVRSQSLHVEVEAAGHTSWSGEAAESCRRSGVVHVQL